MASHGTACLKGGRVIRCRREILGWDRVACSVLAASKMLQLRFDIGYTCRCQLSFISAKPATSTENSETFVDVGEVITGHAERETVDVILNRTKRRQLWNWCWKRLTSIKKPFRKLQARNLSFASFALTSWVTAINNRGACMTTSLFPVCLL